MQLRRVHMEKKNEKLPRRVPLVNNGNYNNKQYVVYLCPPIFVHVPLVEAALIPIAKVPRITDNLLGNMLACKNFICITSRTLGPCLFMFGGRYGGPLCNEVYRLNLHKPTASFKKCREMAASADYALTVQVGDCFYVLSMSDEPATTPVFQKYDIDSDYWSLIPDVDNIITKPCSKYDECVIYNTSSVPHVVINHKLHVYLGHGYSLCFDTHKQSWKHSNLFKNFWSNPSFSVSNFYGGPTWSSAFLRNSRPCHSFGFYGKAILWDSNILLGVHYSEECQLLAFLLDKGDSVVKSQPIQFMNRKLLGARLVDLGRGGYFGLLHLKDKQKSSIWAHEDQYLMEMVTLRFQD